MTRILKIQIKYELSTKNEREAHKKNAVVMENTECYKT